MRKWYLPSKIILFFIVLFISLNTAFSEGDVPLILPRHLTKMTDKTEKSNRIEKKISSLLQMQVQLRKSNIEQPRPERLSAMQGMGMKTAADKMDQQRVFIHAKRKLSASKIASLEKIGVIVYEDSWIPPLGNHPTGYVIATMPVDRLYDLAAKSYVVRLETAERMLMPKNDKAAKSIHADNVWNDYGYDGSGVRIAVLDSGLDTTHNDIPTPVVIKDYSDYPTLDDIIDNQVTPHGTHVTGSAVGRGTQSDGKYKGMAFGADLIFLKIGNDTDGSASDGAIIAAIKASVDTYNADIITMSYGGFDTYHDGSDETCQAVDYAFGKGALVFMAAGNDGDSKIHYSGTVAAHKKTQFIPVKLGPGWRMLYFYLNWFDGLGESRELDLRLYDMNKKEMPSANITKDREGESPRGTEALLTYYNSYIYIYGHATYYLKVVNNSDCRQFFHIYSFDEYTTFKNADPRYTVGSPAIADSAIAVASYVTRPKWKNYKGEAFRYITDKTVGKISSFSSRGPRIDGVKKPDIAAPGQGVISARDKIISWPGIYDYLVIDNDGINDGYGPADYLCLQGTSMATPIAAGASALLMQTNPSLKGDPTSVQNILFQTASNKGKQTNKNGYGKLNVLSALNFINSMAPASVLTLTTSPSPALTTPTLSTFPTPTP
jgi:subtilisin family serine protease